MMKYTLKLQRVLYYIWSHLPWFRNQKYLNGSRYRTSILSFSLVAKYPCKVHTKNLKQNKVKMF